MSKSAFRSILWAASFAAALLLAGAGQQGATAAEPAPDSDGAAQAEFQQLFQRMLRNPADLDLIFKYAEAAIKLGNYEAAVTALERLLLFNPDLPRVHLELGVLYFRLGSFPLAQSYFDKALSYPDTPAEVRRRVAAFQEELARRNSPHKWSVNLTSGLRWQSNANTGVDGLIRAGILPGQDVFTPSSSGRPKADLNGFVQTTAEYAYDLGGQYGDALTVGFTGYGAWQRRQKQVNIGFGELRAGPRLSVAPESVPGWTVRPYVMTGALALDNEPYFTAGGGGVETRAPLSDRLALDAAVETARRVYHNSGAQPAASEQTGGVYSGELRLLTALTPDLTFTLGTGLTKENAATQWNTSLERRVSAGLILAYDAPFGLAAPRWSAALTASREWEEYDGADPSVDPDTVRRDRTWRVTAVTSAPLSERYGLTASLQRVTRASDIPNYRYDNWTAALGVSVRFQ